MSHERPWPNLTIPFDPAEVLDTPDAQREYIRQVLEDGDADELARAMMTVLRAQKMHGNGPARSEA